MEEKAASNELRLIVVRVRKELIEIRQYVSRREVSIGIVHLTIEFRGNRRAGE